MNKGGSGVERILRDDTVLLYEYTTYPVVEKEIPELSELYYFHFQMTTYREATVMLFSMKTGICLFFTHEAKLVEL